MKDTDMMELWRDSVWFSYWLSLLCWHSFLGMLITLCINNNPVQQTKYVICWKAGLGLNPSFHKILFIKKNNGHWSKSCLNSITLLKSLRFFEPEFPHHKIWLNNTVQCLLYFKLFYIFIIIFITYYLLSYTSTFMEKHFILWLFKTLNTATSS